MTNNVHYLNKEDFPIHDLLTCVRTLTRLDDVHPERRLNAENYLKSQSEMAELFSGYPEAVKATVEIAEQCEPALDLTATLYPAFDLLEGEKAASFLHQAADSAVAYCLFITDVDAVGRGLLFERFMSLERAGADRVASVCTYNTFQARSAVRDFGKAMDFPPGEIDRLAKRMPWIRADEIQAALKKFPELRQSDLPIRKFERLIEVCAAVAGFPRHLGTHLGGVVISRDPLTNVTPMDDAVRIINREGPRLDYDRIEFDDRETYQMLNSGQTIGVFQLESPAQRALQSRLGASQMEDIVASMAIIRPGPIKGNMVEPFITRRQGHEPITYLHPRLKPILEKTYGVVLFQEQVIEIATVIAGFTPGQADRLRRVMTHSRHREEMEEIGRDFVKKATVRGIRQEVAETIFSYVVGCRKSGGSGSSVGPQSSCPGNRCPAQGRLARRRIYREPTVRVRREGRGFLGKGEILDRVRAPRDHGPRALDGSLEDEFGLTDVTVFEEVYQKYGQMIFTDPVVPLKILGKVQRRGNSIAILAERVGVL